MSETKIAIVGVTGRLGRLIAAELLKKPNVIVHGICRNPTKVSDKLSSHSRLKIFRAECNESEALQVALRGTSVCIASFLGSLDDVLVEGQKSIIDACIVEKVSRYVAADFSFDFRPHQLGEVPLKDFALHINAYLEEKECQGLIQAVHVFNGIFLETYFAHFFPAYDPKHQTLHVWGTGNEVLEMTTYDDTAKFAAIIALDPKAVGYMGFIGDRKTSKELTQLYQRVYGEELKLDTHGTLDELFDNASTTMKEQPKNLFAWVFNTVYYYLLSGAAEVRNVDLEYAKDLKPTSLEEFFRENRKEKLPHLVDSL